MEPGEKRVGHCYVHTSGLNTSFSRSVVLLESYIMGMFCPLLILAGTIHCFWKVFTSGLRAFTYIRLVQDTLAQYIYIFWNKVEGKLLIAVLQRKSNIIGIGKHIAEGGLASYLQLI